MNDTELDQAVEQMRLGFVERLNELLPDDWMVIAQRENLSFQFVCMLNIYRYTTSELDFACSPPEKIQMILELTARYIVEAYQRTHPA